VKSNNLNHTSVSSSDNPSGIDQSSAAEMGTARFAVLILQGNLPRYFTYTVPPKKKQQNKYF